MHDMCVCTHACVCVCGKACTCAHNNCLHACVVLVQGIYQVSSIGKDPTGKGGCGLWVWHSNRIPSLQIVVDGRLLALGDPHNSVYALGDCAEVQRHAHPCTAQVAERQGRYIAKSLGHVPSPDSPTPPEFAFQSWGMLAYVGGYRAIHDTKMDKSRGRWLHEVVTFRPNPGYKNYLCDLL